MKRITMFALFASVLGACAMDTAEPIDGHSEHLIYASPHTINPDAFNTGNHTGGSGNIANTSPVPINCHWSTKRRVYICKCELFHGCLDLDSDCDHAIDDYYTCSTDHSGDSG